MKAHLVPPKDVLELWPEIQPLLDKALAYGIEDVTAQDLLPAIEESKAYLWIGVDGYNIECVVLGELVEYPRKKSFYIHAWATKSGHQFDEFMELFEGSVITFAKINGCDFIEAKVRKGLAKKLKWNDKHSLVTLTLGD
tara:strand:+ start:202 stop:618 length:417 start_codon:yes stop_codon:yes gene_type:complete